MRYSTAGKSRTLFRSADAETLKQLHPENPRFARLRDDDYVIVSEPFSDLPGVWHEIPEATVITLRRRRRRPGGVPAGGRARYAGVKAALEDQPARAVLTLALRGASTSLPRKRTPNLSRPLRPSRDRTANATEDR